MKEYYTIDRHSVCLQQMIFVPEEITDSTVFGFVRCMSCDINYPAEYDKSYFKKLKEVKQDL